MTVTPTANTRPELAVERFGLYVVSDDLTRSAAFYGQLFGKEPQVSNAGLVGFDVAGGFYAIVSRQAYAPNSVRGDRTIPYIKVADIESAFERSRLLSPESLVTDRVVAEGPFRLFKIKDPDGNIVEFFSVSLPRK